MSTTNQLKGNVVLAYLDALEVLGLREAVRARVPPATAATMDRPPLATQWVDIARLDEMSQAVLEGWGTEKVREFGYLVARDSTVKRLEPLLESALLFGERHPGTLFANVGPALGLMMRGADYRFAATGPGEGVISLGYEAPVSESRFHGWEGVFRCMIERAGLAGSVALDAISPDRRRGVFAVRWPVPQRPQ